MKCDITDDILVYNLYIISTSYIKLLSLVKKIKIIFNLGSYSQSLNFFFFVSQYTAESDNMKLLPLLPSPAPPKKRPNTGKWNLWILLTFAK